MRRKKRPVSRDETTTGDRDIDINHGTRVIEIADESERRRIEYRLRAMLGYIREHKRVVQELLVNLKSYGLILRFEPPPVRPDDLPRLFVHDEVEPRSSYRDIAQAAIDLGLILAETEILRQDFRRLWRHRRNSKTAGSKGGKAKQNIAAERKPEILTAFADWVQDNPGGSLAQFATEFAERKKSIRGFSIRTIRGVVDRLEQEIVDQANTVGFRGMLGQRRINAISKHLEGKPGMTPATIRFFLR